jgi:hypothetical protein
MALAEYRNSLRIKASVANLTTPIAKGSVNLSDGKAYQLVLSGGG